MGCYKRRQRKYAKISVKKRQELIKMVFQQGTTQKYAADKLKIKLETAKLIIKKYRSTGTFFMKKMPKYKKNHTNPVQNQQSKEFKAQVFQINQKNSSKTQSPAEPTGEILSVADCNICYFYYPFSYSFPASTIIQMI